MYDEKNGIFMKSGPMPKGLDQIENVDHLRTLYLSSSAKAAALKEVAN
jgi:hypothetical protein